MERFVIEKLPCWERSLGFEFCNMVLTIYCDQECLSLQLADYKHVFADKMVGKFLRQIKDRLLDFFKTRSLLSDTDLYDLLAAVRSSHEHTASDAEILSWRATQETDMKDKNELLARAKHSKRVSEDFAFVEGLLSAARDYRHLKGNVDPKSLL